MRYKHSTTLNVLHIYEDQLPKTVKAASRIHLKAVLQGQSTSKSWRWEETYWPHATRMHVSFPRNLSQDVTWFGWIRGCTQEICQRLKLEGQDGNPRVEHGYSTDSDRASRLYYSHQCSFPSSPSLSWLIEHWLLSQHCGSFWTTPRDRRKRLNMTFFVEWLIMDKDCSSTVSLYQQWWSVKHIVKFRGKISLIYIKVSQRLEHCTFSRNGYAILSLWLIRKVAFFLYTSDKNHG